MVFLILETHRACFSAVVSMERAQGVAGQGVIIAAGIDVFKFSRFVKVTFRVGAFE